MILRWLIIGSLIFYVLYKMGFFRALASGYHEPQNRKRAEGHVNINTPPKEKKKSSFKGGEYVDYEEIK